MNVEVPSIKVTETSSGEAYPYSFAEMTSEADYSVEKISRLIGKLLKLAEIEKTVAMLAVEIERNKRRVNALEYIMIPQIEETVKYIKSKLDENERANTIRLMKVKDLILQEAIEEKKAEDMRAIETFSNTDDALPQA